MQIFFSKFLYNLTILPPFLMVYNACSVHFYHYMQNSCKSHPIFFIPLSIMGAALVQLLATPLYTQKTGRGGLRRNLPRPFSLHNSCYISSFWAYALLSRILRPKDFILLQTYRLILYRICCKM